MFVQNNGEIRITEELCVKDLGESQGVVFTDLWMVLLEKVDSDFRSLVFHNPQCSGQKLIQLDFTGGNLIC